MLETLGLIDEPTARAFNLVRKARNRYLHFFSKETNNLERDVVDVFLTTVGLVVTVTGLAVKDGKVLLRPELLTRARALTI